MDITPLVNAIDRLAEGLARHLNKPGDDQVRDGLIQRLSQTYELSHRMLRRYLRSVSGSPDQFDQMPFQDLIRTGNQQGLLLSDWPAWRRFRDIRARTSHAYAIAVATQVVAGIPDFLADAAFLRDQLRTRLG